MPVPEPKEFVPPKKVNPLVAHNAARKAAAAAKAAAEPSPAAPSDAARAPASDAAPAAAGEVSGGVIAFVFGTIAVIGTTLAVLVFRKPKQEQLADVLQFPKRIV